MNILEKIAANKRLEVEQLKIDVPLDQLMVTLPSGPKYDFAAAISRQGGTNIIAEIKKGSPSKGIICEQFDPGALAEQYADGGAAALSVLTERKFFFGSFENLKVAKNRTQLPALCKDFFIDPYQLYHALSVGADAALLIVGLLGTRKLAEMISIANEIGLAVLVEVHDREELLIALDSGANIIGVNNRDLSDFSVSLTTSENLAADIPDDVVSVSESGIGSRDDIVRLQQCGFKAFLIGETLVRSDDPASLIRRLTGEAI